MKTTCIEDPDLPQFSSKSQMVGCTAEAQQWIEDNEDVIMWVSIAAICIMVTLFLCFFGKCSVSLKIFTFAQSFNVLAAAMVILKCC